MVSGSIEWENHFRLDILAKNHHNWLVACAKNIANDLELAHDLVGDLYLYLTKPNPKIWYKDSFNLVYCRSFLSSRFLNFKKRSKRMCSLTPWLDKEDEEYDDTLDKKIDVEYDRLIEELKGMKARKGWSSAMLFELYYFSDKTMDQLADDIGLSKSTVFLNTKKVKEHFKRTLNNPFSKDEED
jgi:DNA-directed RNA polymerase specialized sigma24 family protein